MSALAPPAPASGAASPPQPHPSPVPSASASASASSTSLVPPDPYRSDPVVQAFTIPAGHVGNLTPPQESLLAQFVMALYVQKQLRAFPTPYDPVVPAAILRTDAVTPSLPGLVDGQLPGAPHDGPPAAEVEAKGGSQSVATQQRIHLLRWLRAREWNVPQALQMYLRAHQWKYDEPPAVPSTAGPAQTAAQQALDQASYDGVPPLMLEGKLASGWTWPWEQEVSALGWRMYFHKTDKLGRPIFIQDLAGINTSAIFSKVTPADIVEKFSVALESAIRYQYACASSQVPRPIEDNLMIVNLEGLGLSTFWAMKAQLQTLLGILDNNFPELSGRVQIINAPWVFATMFGYIKGWLPAATREKIDIKGADYKQVLLEYIPAENLPVHFGGTCTCADHAPPAVATDGASLRSASTAPTPTPKDTKDASAAALEQHLETLSLTPSGAASVSDAALASGSPSGSGSNSGSGSEAAAASSAPAMLAPAAGHPSTPRTLAGDSAPAVPGGWCTVTNAGPWPETYHGYLHRRVGNKLHSHTSVAPYEGAHAA